MAKTPRFPDFLCIGAQRAGTSWLYRNLKQQPQIWLPPLKELHYFDTQWPSTTSQSNQWNRRWLRHARYFLSRLMDPRKAFDPESKWLVRYLFQPRSDHWYGSLFPADAEIIAGEMTPRYATLNEDVVAHIVRLMPRTKIIYILRNPIERTWSAAAMHLEKQRSIRIDQASDADIRQALEWTQPQIRADYATHIDIWSRHFDKANIFVGFFDDLSDDPTDFLDSIHAFLAIDPSRAAASKDHQHPHWRRLLWHNSRTLSHSFGQPAPGTNQIGSRALSQQTYGKMVGRG